MYTEVAVEVEAVVAGRQSRNPHTALIDPTSPRQNTLLSFLSTTIILHGTDTP